MQVITQLHMRSRASFKIMEINMRHNVIKKSSLVVDLGASPGGWSQLALQVVGVDQEAPRVFAMDIAPMDYVLWCKYSSTGASSCSEILPAERIY